MYNRSTTLWCQLVCSFRQKLRCVFIRNIDLFVILICTGGKIRRRPFAARGIAGRQRRRVTLLGHHKRVITFEFVISPTLWAQPTNLAWFDRRPPMKTWLRSSLESEVWSRIPETSWGGRGQTSSPGSHESILLYSSLMVRGRAAHSAGLTWPGILIIRTI